MTSSRPRRPSRLHLSLVISALLSAVLACARADIPAIVPTPLPPRPTSIPPTEAPTLPPTPTPEPPTSTPSAPEPVASPTFPATPTHSESEEPGTIVYMAQPGDTLRTLAIRFGVVPSDIVSPEGPVDDENALVNVDQLLLVPRRLSSTGPADRLIPDSEFVFSPNALDFDPNGVATREAGFLPRYQETVGGLWRTGPEVIALAARDNSVNPRLLMAILEYVAGWVTNPTRPEGDDFRYPLGHNDPATQGLYRQLTWLANELGNGYYGWRSGTLTELQLADGTRVRLAPELNAGTVAVQYYFSLFMGEAQWREAVAPSGFAVTYFNIFGDPWSYYHPLYEPGLQQPEMILPFTE
ncbi:MAG TPA: hypothetical protein VFI11_02175, partial [Anaerolineales bacterium]|nr:hypothetical protein [Anaerolineales bacterium]